MHLYAITDRRLFPGDELARCARLLSQAERWVNAGVSIVQLREKDLPLNALEELATQLVKLAHGTPTRILINAATVQPGTAALADPSTHAMQVAIQTMAIRTGADGLHLPSPILSAAGNDLEGIRTQWRAMGREPLLSMACHSAEEAAAASGAGASLILFAPVFEKRLASGSIAGIGLDALHAACTAAKRAPVYALGGVTPANAPACISAGAAGVAAIRLFAAEDWTTLAL